MPESMPVAKTLSVAAIQHGTVIDHIVSGQAFRILQLLRLIDKPYKITVGMHLPSKQLGYKDLIKIENYSLTQNQANEITVFAPDASINIIKDFAVAEKINPHLPDFIEGVFCCQNPHCITQEEEVKSFFSIKAMGRTVKLTCRFCEKTVDRNQVKVAL